MPPIQRLFNCTQQQLYAIGRAAWASCNTRIAEFFALKAKYTILFVTAKVSDINTAEALPDDEQRKQTAQLLRDQMIVKAEECRDAWQKLKLYIEEAFPANELDTQLSAAGKSHYANASRDNWDAVKRLMIDGDAFITANTVALSANLNMPAGFPLIFATVKNDFETLYNDFVNATLDTEVKTQDKLIANNAVYTDLSSMLKDGQRIFKDDEAVRKLFTFEQLLLDIAGPGIAGVRGLIKAALTNSAINVIVTVTAENTDYITQSDPETGRYQMSPMAAGIYTIVFTAPGFQTLRVENVEIEVGTLHTLNVTMTAI